MKLFLLQRPLKWGHVTVFWYCSNSIKKNKSATEKVISDGKLRENMHGTETEYVSVKGSLNIHSYTSTETAFVSEIPNIINGENVIIAPGQGKNQFKF